MQGGCFYVPLDFDGPHFVHIPTRICGQFTYRRYPMKLKERNPDSKPPISKPDRIGRRMYQAAVVATMTAMCSIHAFAAGETVWTKAQQIMSDVYGQIVTISTIAAVMTASVALLLMNFSKNGRTVDESRAWLKRICITWAIINGLGFIMAYVTPFFEGGEVDGLTAAIF